MLCYSTEESLSVEYKMQLFVWPVFLIGACTHHIEHGLYCGTVPGLCLSGVHRYPGHLRRML